MSCYDNKAYQKLFYYLLLVINNKKQMKRALKKTICIFTGKTIKDKNQSIFIYE